MVFWVGAAAAVTLLLWLLRERLEQAHMALAYLLVILGASARHGRTLGILLAVLCFFAFNFFLLPPYYTFTLRESIDWIILLSFLVTSSVAAQLLHRAQTAASLANRRAREIDRLASLGADSLAAAHAEDAVRATARVILAELRIRSCDVVVPDGEIYRYIAPETAASPPAVPEGLIEYVLREQRIVAITAAGTTHVEPGDTTLAAALGRAGDARALLVPLRVRSASVGVLRLFDPRFEGLDAPQSAFADVLANYVALAVERVRLVAEAERADALRETDRLKDALLASVSHDLRTPLTSIRALASEIRSDGDARAAVIEEEADRLNRMVADLLELSQLQAGGLHVRPELNAVDDLIGAALQRVSGMPGGEQIGVDLPPGEVVLAGRFDLVHTLRALVNLLENALRHSPDPGSVQVRVVAQPDELIIAVLDRGPGVPDSERDRIFEPFYRGAAPAPRSTGTGLGLAIARGIMQAQGGSLVYRPRSGGGSAFELRVPGAQPASLPDLG
jgi:two-component system sensor histidine kinase KdpD